MRIRFGLALGLICAAAYGRQSPISFARSYKVGDKLHYALSLNMAAVQGELDVSMTIVESVTKVYDDGGADVESASSDVKLRINGKESPSSRQNQSPAITRTDRFGTPIGKSTRENGSFLKYAKMLPHAPMKIGETSQIDFKNPENPKELVKGTAFLESLKDGIAKLVSRLEVTNESTISPMKIASVTYFDVNAKRWQRMEGTISDLPKQNGLQISAVQFVMEMKG